MPTRILLAHLDPEVEAELDQVLANSLLEVEHTTKDESFIDWRQLQRALVEHRSWREEWNKLRQAWASRKPHHIAANQ